MSDRDVQAIAEHVKALTDGFPERIDYYVTVKTHKPKCLDGQLALPPGARKHHQCDCRADLERRAETRDQPPLLAQLRQARAPRSSGMVEGGRRAAESQPPGPLDAADLLALIDQRAEGCRAWLAPHDRRVAASDLSTMLRRLVSLAAASADEEAVHAAHDALRRSVRAARIVLGYDTPMRELVDVSCGQCGGVLVVAPDASTDVRCVNPECRVIYRRWQWIELLVEQERQLEGEGVDA